ncbi:MAG: leucine--tRNA ligase [bacterium TMED198]|nr:MAG: leucine--tRNA ligase [bacterium TMED198]
MSIYNYKEIEKKWQENWKVEHETFDYDLKNKYYCLTMFSYPSGDKLHIGHWYNYGPVDTFARFKRMRGKSVFQPQGFDSFGLPAENFAIKNGVHPRESTMSNIGTMRKQLSEIGAMFDWSAEVVTSRPDYYRWTQWLFKELYINKLAYRREALVNWDPVDQTVLANEQVLADGTSERSGAFVEQKALKQWFFKITDYAEELLSFDGIDWPGKTMAMQKNWIGRSSGAEILFNVESSEISVKVYTTRPDTLYGASYLVLSPEHDLLQKITTDENVKCVDEYCKEAQRKNELERTDLNKDKTGVFSGSYAINPINGEKIQIWIADYVLSTYGTGAIMAVPGHDERDHEFAKKYSLEIIKVIDCEDDEIPFTGLGSMVNSELINGMDVEEAKQKIITFLEKNSFGASKINYKLKDWLISRQRYWGCPIPVVYSPDGVPHLIPDKHLPWLLPDDVDYKPKGTSPLGSSKELVDRTEAIFGKGWKPEVDTMDTFVCSSWYYLRYPDSRNTQKPFSKESLDWLPVDCYVGGSEHATMHLLYARFVTKALRDLGHLSFDEPFKKLFHQGTITKDGAKMSKSKGNTVSPDKFIENYGSDIFRAYLMFMGPFDDGGDWNDSGITGISRFVNKVWSKFTSDTSTACPEHKDIKVLHKTVKAVTSDFESMKFNTAISKLMELMNHFASIKISSDFRVIFLKLLAPISPHLCEELWEREGRGTTIFNESWPDYDEKLTIDDMLTIVVQVNGKLRSSIDLPNGVSKEEVLGLCKKIPKIDQYLKGKTIIKEIYIPGKLVNLVIK